MLHVVSVCWSLFYEGQSVFVESFLRSVLVVLVHFECENNCCAKLKVSWDKCSKGFDLSIEKCVNV